LRLWPFGRKRDSDQPNAKARGGQFWSAPPGSPANLPGSQMGPPEGLSSSPRAVFRRSSVAGPEPEAREDPLHLDEFRVDPDFSHIWVESQDKCRYLCQRRECLYLCPGGVFVSAGGEKGPLIQVRYERCLECGACQMFCPGGNVHLEFPRGGYGIIHRYG